MKKHIPNLLTLLNLFSGLVALLFAFEQKYEWVFWWVLAGIVFDFFDGFAARLLKVQSPLGVQLDSLADMVTSGVVPSVVMFSLLKEQNPPTYLPFVAFFIALSSAVRLAKFNIDTRQSSSFIGLPTPANSLFICSLPFILERIQTNFILNSLLIITAFSTYILNSHIPMFSLKFKSLSVKENAFVYAFLLISVVILVAFKLKSVPFVILLYISVSVFENLWKKFSHKL